MKYINADKLKVEIEKRAKFHNDAIKACIGLNNVAITHSAGWKEDTEIITIIDSLQQEEKSVAERFARIVRGNLIGIDKEVQQKFEQLYVEVTGNKMYGGFND